MREIVLDTETTGLNPLGGDRIVEIGCVELVNHLATGRVYHQYVNPERDMPDGAFAVHGLSEEFLSEHPVFADIADDFLEFVGTDTLVIHNAQFDMGFINAELARMDRPALPMEQATDTVAMARKKFPGAQASLDALCRRFQIDNSERTKHGALLDSELLAEVYLELIGGRQPDLELASELRSGAQSTETETADNTSSARPPRPHAASADENAAHEKFLGRLNNPIWQEQT
ncbi:MAG: DNA polymerase III subunit epsilon [Rhodospirillaceae bacterium]|nr:DNA polymerase III subunit epsilon [Rhodospirillaceae bacterium]MBT4219890.1 DNA polymerase III subunit epsilon [Rhodospirillaceae bacterium]MBT4463812.1 DNA polymerase III subunit epsilon [Rhodospirillaceae bacterium]MBT5013686.1 DNA polymerase III subunit epsilon [Rhodospirillaceae bacterium]MBT5308468.1 DNA polymerase III subunit epsilon [Rhodospirillaceae bacterium]